MESFWYDTVCVAIRRKDTFKPDRATGEPGEAHKSNFLHPVLYFYKNPPTGNVASCSILLQQGISNLVSINFSAHVYRKTYLFFLFIEALSPLLFFSRTTSLPPPVLVFFLVLFSLFLSRHYLVLSPCHMSSLLVTSLLFSLHFFSLFSSHLSSSLLSSLLLFSSLPFPSLPFPSLLIWSLLLSFPFFLKLG